MGGDYYGYNEGSYDDEKLYAELTDEELKAINQVELGGSQADDGFDENMVIDEIKGIKKRLNFSAAKDLVNSVRSPEWKALASAASRILSPEQIEIMNSRIMI